MVSRCEVYLVDLEPTVGSELQKVRPCVIVSPDELNRHLRTVLVCPLTSSRTAYPFRVDCQFADREGQIATDQMRVLDRSRLGRCLGRLDDATGDRLLRTLSAMFAA